MNQPFTDGLAAMDDPRARDLGECVARLERRHGHFRWDAAFSDLVVILAQVQLALRHPSNAGASADRAREILNAWIDSLASAEPGVAAPLRMGFDPQYDTPTDVETLDMQPVRAFLEANSAREFLLTFRPGDDFYRWCAQFSRSTDPDGRIWCPTGHSDTLDEAVSEAINSDPYSAEAIGRES